MAEVNWYYLDICDAISEDLPWEELEDKTVLVTGATGLIGGAVVDMLMAATETCRVVASGRNEERAKHRFTRYAKEERFQFLKMDVTEPITATDLTVDYIIDAAGGATPHLYKENPVGVMRSNLMGVDHLLQYGIAHGLRRFVFISSGEVYGEGDGRAFTEDYSGFVDPLSVRSCYPSAKRAAETLSICYGQQYGFDVCIARPSHVYGPGYTDEDDRVYAQFLRNVERGEDIVLKSKGEAYRSWTYVVDCASAILHILLRGKAGEAYNIADPDSNISISFLAQAIALNAGRQVVYDIPDDGTQGVTTPITKAIFDVSRLKALGWQPQIDISRALFHSIEQL